MSEETRVEEYIPSPENRKRWCQGKVGNQHQFQYLRYYPKAAGYPNGQAFFEFRCIVCGRRRYTTDEEGQIELEDDGSLEEEETPEPRPTELQLNVSVDARASDGSFRRISSHTEFINVALWSDERLAEYRAGLLKAAYSAFDQARNFEFISPSEPEDLPSSEL
jgi:hypothetical protein